MLKKTLYYLPRVLAILFNAFLALFALDVFDQPQWPIALLMHLIPNFILALLTALAWKYERLGGLVFIAVGLLLLIFSRWESMILSVLLMVIGGLFLGREYLAKLTK